jgi:hypothetical protein
MSTSLTGILACDSISTTTSEVITQESPPYKAWPEITEWNRYYVFPTIRAIYYPDIPTSDEDWAEIEKHWSHVITAVSEYCLSNFGSEADDTDFEVSLIAVLRSLEKEGFYLKPLPERYSPEQKYGTVSSFV